MVCDGLEIITDTSLTGILAYPTICDPQFYAKIMGALFVIISLTLFYSDRDRVGFADFISCMGVSALAIISISIAGTFIGIIQADIFIEIFVICIIFIGLWLVKGD